MAITPPTIQKSVYNRIPYLVIETDNDDIIDAFTAEVMGEVYKVMEIPDTDILVESSYSILQKSLIADLVSVQLLKRRVLINAEGQSGEAATGNKVLKRAKAGEAETEFQGLKASDGVKLLASAESLIQMLMNDALRKARTLGFILDIKADGEFIVKNMSMPGPGLNVVSWD